MDLIIQRIKTIIGSSAKDKDEVISVLAQIQKEAVLAYIGVDTLPAVLEFIVIETTLARYNQLGSEGIVDKKIDGLSMKYSQNLLNPYLTYMNRYIDLNGTETKTSKVRFR